MVKGPNCHLEASSNSSGKIMFTLGLKPLGNVLNIYIPELFFFKDVFNKPTNVDRPLNNEDNPIIK